MPISSRTGDNLAGAATVDTVVSAVAHSDSLALPSNPLVNKATALMVETLPPFLCNHSVRGFLFGRAIAQQRGLQPGIDYDEETMYLICVLHDLGLAENATGDLPFEIDGADVAARFLEDNGVTDARVDTIWDAVAAHTIGFIESPVFQRRRPPEIRIAVQGIGIDVGGAPTDLPPGYADLVHASYPRLGGTRALTASIAAQAIANPRKAPPVSLAAEILRAIHPDRPLPGWDTFTDASGWQD